MDVVEHGSLEFDSIDYLFRDRAGAQPGAVSEAHIKTGRKKAYKDCLKFVVWHHPRNSPFEDRIKDTEFMQRLALGW